jgi:ABC-type transport system involved in multi-copper enzyme maturation permease subunit
MTWLTWRQFRTQSAVALGALLIVAVTLAITGPHLLHVYRASVALCQANRGLSAICSNPVVSQYRLLQLSGTVLAVVPGMLGIFWGAPLVARELETGTSRLAWTQSVSRTRWLAVKLSVAGLASMAAAGLFSLMVTWWSSPIDLVNGNRFAAGMFGERGITPIGYAAFAFALGVTAGVLIRRTLPAMATTIVAFVAARVSITLWVRQHLLAPTVQSLSLSAGSMGFGSSNGGPVTLFPNPPDIHNAWIYSTQIVDNAGRPITSQFVASACPHLGAGGPPGGGAHSGIAVPGNVQKAFQDCITNVGAKFHELVTYQPASRYWAFQWYETAIFVALAIMLCGFCFWWVRRTS